MFNKIENRTIYGFIDKQNVITIKDFEEAYKNILSAVDSGEIGMDRLDESVQRILTVKFMRGIIPENVDSPVQAATAQAVTITPQ